MINNPNSIKRIEESLGITFNNKLLLTEAITHSSFVNQNKDNDHNERLEFLGDSVLQLTISEYLYKNYPLKSEGELTRTRSLIVCENSLHEVAKGLSLGQYIYMSKGEELTGGRDRVSILADCVEAIIAAIYLDHGIEKAKNFILRNFEHLIKKAIYNEIVLDYKTKLQETLQQKGVVSIVYNLMKFEGPPHRRKFYTEVSVDGRLLGIGSGFSKKEAEQNAAKEALADLEGVRSHE